MKYAMQAIQLYNMAEQFIEHKNGQELREKQRRLNEMRLRHAIASEPEKQAIEQQANELKRQRDAFALLMEPTRQDAMIADYQEKAADRELRDLERRLDETRLRHDIAAEPEKQALEQQADELKRQRDAFALLMEPARQDAKIADLQEKEEERDANRELRRGQLAGDMAEILKRNLDAKRQYVDDVENTVGDGEEEAKAAIAAYRDAAQAYHDVMTSNNGDMKTLLGVAASPGSDDGTVTQNSVNSVLANADRYGMSETDKQYMIETVGETQILASTGEETSRKIFAGQNDPERMARAYVYGDSELPEEDELSAIPTDQYDDLVSGMAEDAINRYRDMSGASGGIAMKKQGAFVAAMQAVKEEEDPVRYEAGKEVAKRLGNFISSDRQTALAKYDADYEQEQAADLLDVAEVSLLDFANLPGKTIFDLATAERIDRERLTQRIGAGKPVEDKEVAASVLEVGGDALRKLVLAGKGASGEAIALAQSAIIEKMKDRVLASKVSPAKTERAYSALSRASKIVEAGGSIGGALGTLLEVSTEKYLKYLPVEMERQSVITKKERTQSTLNREYHNAETVYPVDGGGEPILVSLDTGENGRAYVQLLAGQPSKLYGNVTYRVFGEEAIPGLENRIDLVVKGEGVVPIHSSRFVEDPANLVTMGYAPSFHVGAASQALDEYAKKDGTETAKPQLVLKDGHWTIGPVRSGITWRPHKSARVTNQQKAAVQSIQYGAVESILSQGPSLTRLLEGFGPNVLLSDADDKDFIFSDTDNIVVESPLYRAINTSGLEEELVAGLNLLLFDGYDVLMENVTPVEAKLAVAKKYQEIAVEALGDFVGASVDPAHQQELIARTGFYEDEVSATGQRNFILITRGMNRLGINPLGSMGGVQYKVPGPSDVYTPKDRGPGL